jgi:glutamate racemase
VSQPTLVADSLADYLDRHPEFNGGSGAIAYLTSGDPMLVGRRAAVFTGHPLTFAAA